MHGAFSIPRKTLALRPTDQSCHHETWLHLDFVDWRNCEPHHEETRPTNATYRASCTTSSRATVKAHQWSHERPFDLLVTMRPFACADQYYAENVQLQKVTWWHFAVEFNSRHAPWKHAVHSMVAFSFISSLHCAPHPSRTPCRGKKQSLWQTFGAFDLVHSLHKWVPTILSCGKHCQAMQTGTVSRLRFCKRSWGFKIYIRWNIVHFRKPYICSNKLDVQETNVSVAQFNRIRILFLGRRIEVGWYARTWFHRIWSSFFLHRNTHQND